MKRVRECERERESANVRKVGLDRIGRESVVVYTIPRCISILTRMKQYLHEVY